MIGVGVSSVRAGRRGVWLLLFLIGFPISGCYTRQIEGIHKDLDLLDRKLHKVNLTHRESSAIAGRVGHSDLAEIKRELEVVRSEQSTIQNHMESLRQEVSDSTVRAGALGPEPGARGPNPGFNEKEVGDLKNKIAKNQKEIERVSKEMNDLKSTFEAVKTETLALISLLREEFPSEPNQLGASGLRSTQVESPMAPFAKLEEPGPDSSSESQTYVVEAGDSLSSIASRFGVGLNDLKRINQIDDPRSLKLGQTLYIP